MPLNYRLFVFGESDKVRVKGSGKAFFFNILMTQFCQNERMYNIRWAKMVMLRGAVSY